MAYRGDPRSTRRWQRLCAEVRAYAEVCEIPGCGLAIDFNAPPRSRWSFSVDHIIAVTNTDEDDELWYDPANVRPAHYGCNSRRGATPDTPTPPTFVAHDDEHSRAW